MKITVFGSTGQTGMEVVKQALGMGIQVKAFVRDPSKIEKKENLEIVEGDVLVAETVASGVEGSDAVVVVLGGKPDTKMSMLTSGTQNIIDAMKKNSVKRIIVQSSFPMSGNEESMNFISSIMGAEDIKAMQPVFDDKKGQEKAIVESGLDWTIIKPTFLSNGEKTENYQVAEHLEVKPDQKISRADVADFILKELKDSKWLNKIVILA